MMSAVQFKDIMAGLQSLATVIAIAAGGWWTYIRFVREREAVPRIQFTVAVRVIGQQASSWIVELLALVDNKGKVRHTIREFRFDLRYLNEGDQIAAGGPKIGEQVNVFRKAQEGSWMPPDWGYTFIEPGVNTRYSFISSLPSTATFALLHGRFAYEGSDDFHTADCMIAVIDPTLHRSTAEGAPADAG